MGTSRNKQWLLSHENCPEISCYAEDDIDLLVGVITGWSLEPYANQVDKWKTEFIKRHLHTLKLGEEQLVQGSRITAVLLLSNI